MLTVIFIACGLRKYRIQNMDNDKRPEDESVSRLKKKKRKLTIVTGILLGIMFIFDIVLFVLDIIQWYMFVPVAIMYFGVFPFAVITLTKLKPPNTVVKDPIEEQEKAPLGEYDE